MRVLRTLCTIAGGSVFGVMNGPVSPVAQAQGTHAVLPVSVVQQPTPAARTVSLDVKDSTLKYVLDALISQARLRPVYRNTSQLTRRITFKVRNVNVMDAIATALQGTGMVARMAPDGSTVMIRPTQDTTTPADRQNSGKVQGEVKDSSNGKPLTGVAISIKGSRLTTVSDASGSFTLTGLSAGEHTVQLRYLGYASTTRLISVTEGKTAVLRVLLRPAASMLSGVVTTATGQQRKLEIGNSITTLKVDSIMQTAPITSVTDLLEGRVPGLTVQRTSGSPGDPARIRLRGAGSINQNNDPIIVVDGIRVYSQQSDERNLNAGGRTVAGNGGQTRVLSSYATPSPLDQIDPNTIETIEVLKGPSASALYGSDAANGVIVITTKRGQAGPARWNMALNHGWSSMPGKWPVGIWKFGTGIGGGAPQVCLGLCSNDGIVDSVKHFQALNDPRYTALGTGSDNAVSISVTGGRQAMQYAFTVSSGRTIGILKLPQVEADRYLQEHQTPAPKWMRRPEQLKRWNTTGQVTMEINEQANVSVTSEISKQSQHRTSMSNSVETAIYELERRYIDESQALIRPLLGNPYERVTSDLTTFRNSAQLRYQPLSWLPINGTFGVSTQLREDQSLLARGMLHPAYDPNYVGPDSTGFLRSGNANVTQYSATINTLAQLRERLSLALGLNYTKASTKDFRGSFGNLPVGVSNPSTSVGDSTATFGRYITGQQTFGWYLEPRLNISSRFFAMPGFRLDNNGLSGKNAKFLSLPKLNFSWIASDEPLFPLQNIFQLLRLRAAFGMAGVQPSPQDGLRLYARERLGTQSAAGAAMYGDVMSLSNLGNTRLRPERGYEGEGGFDAEVWNGRLTMDFTYYRKKRIDAIIQQPVSLSVGGGQVWMNMGDILNTGVELAATAQLFERQALGWNVNMSVSRNRSRVIKLGSEYEIEMRQLFDELSVNTYYVTGYPMNGIWSRPIYGFNDIDGNGFVTSEEILFGDANTRVYMGASDPSYLANLNSTVMLFGGRLGIHTGFSYVGGLTQRDLKAMEPTTFAEQGYWLGSPFALAINDPRVGLGQQAAAVGAQSGVYYGMIRRTNTLRFQSLSINLNLGADIARRIRAGNVGVALQGSNLALWSNYQGKDPNVNAFSTGQMTGDMGQLPQPRTWTLRVTVGR